MNRYPHDTHAVCTRCCRLRSIDSTAVRPPDRCACADKQPDDRFNAEDMIACTICASCALAIVRGHTRWSMVHCKRCWGNARRINETAGRVVVPMGIHTIVNGLSLSGADAASEDKFEAFATQMLSLFERISELQAHTDRLVGARLNATGLDRFDTVPFEDYLDACSQRSITAADGWAELARFVDGSSQ
jgi:hypothetical protein